MSAGRGSITRVAILDDYQGMVNRGIDVAHAKTKGIVVCVFEDANVKASKVPWQSTIPMGLAGRTLGLVGVGKLGSKTAKIAKAFNMEVIAWSPNLTPDRAEKAGVTFVPSKEELFRQSDIVSIHMVLSNRTHHMITTADFALMKPTAFFINTSRGPLVDEPALIEALKQKKIAGAGWIMLRLVHTWDTLVIRTMKRSGTYSRKYCCIPGRKPKACDGLRRLGNGSMKVFGVVWVRLSQLASQH
ncbi:D-3-phosphoglycerate dehydrogenase [Grifola frondosa]|uniref:D-3-phosphoglycerate dehydrogenase n=1 Tax=Grifola frondosa TaxID=5627 RepID=A0A1C7MRW4_GRIFR|nr:D-3-phosphoglycerate dehydrogenase [Grifola frondosa]